MAACDQGLFMRLEDTSSILMKFLILLVVLSGRCVSADLLEVTIGVYQPHYEELLSLGNDKSCLEWEELGPNQIQLIELNIICHAFKQAGIEAAFKLKPLPLYRRVLEQINTGEIDLSAHPMWEHDYNPDFALKSDPVLGRDDSVKLLYTRKNHPTLFGAKTAQDFKELNSATNATWDLDLALLHCITSSVIKTRNYEEIYKVVGSGRADMTLDYPIATDDGSKTFGDVTLYPVPDYKVSMNQEQYFFISKQSKNAQIIRTVLNNGIRNLRENNIITNTYTRAGYINNKVKDWQFLRCHQ